MNEKGFTILELIIALGLTAVVGAVVAVNLRLQSAVYLTDVKRLRIQQNLRSALDIISMNVRQAGEGLDGLFPALLLRQSTSPVTSVLTVRRKTLQEVLLVCRAIPAGASRIYVSDDLSPTSDCLPTNVAASVAAWTTARTAASGRLRIYIFDRVGRVGEFLDNTASGTESGDDYLQVSALKVAYPATSTSIYVMEEYEFALDTASQTLRLTVNGYTNSPDDLAYNITAFTVGLRMQSGTNVTSLLTNDALGWKNLRAVTLSLTGQETWKNNTTQRTVSAEYFPRNVLSK